MTRAGVVAGFASLLAIAGSWLTWNETSSAVTPAQRGGTLDGASVFRSMGCATCHTGPDSLGTFASGPSLRDAREWASTRRPGVSAADYIAESILVPGAFISPRHRPVGVVDAMPTLGLSTEEVDALITYLLAA